MNPILWCVEYFDSDDRCKYFFHFDSEQKAMEKFVSIVNSKPIEKREGLEVIPLNLLQVQCILDSYSNDYERITRRQREN